jgi:hypothetical protein
VACVWITDTGDGAVIGPGTQECWHAGVLVRRSAGTHEYVCMYVCMYVHYV